MKTVVVANQKGGVGKSTLTAHLVYAAVAAKKRVLLVDMDRQGSVSLTFAAPEGSPVGLRASQIYDLKTPKELPQALSPFLSVIRADKNLLLVDKAGAEVLQRPQKNLAQFADAYDLCLIDTPPLLGNRLVGALAAADYVVTPVTVGLYEQAGVADLLETIKYVRTKGLKPDLKFIGILPMKINKRSSLERDGLARMRQQFGAAIMQEEISERAAVRKAVYHGRPVWEATDGESHRKAAQEWKAACKTILQKALQ